MKSLSNWLVVMFAIVFWGFRIITILMAQLGKEFMAQPLNLNMEIVLCFITLLCIILLAKRTLIGAILYLASYGFYFGVDLYQNVVLLFSGQTLELNTYTSMFFSLIGIGLALFAFFDILLDKQRMAHPKDKKTDWFYKNEEYDRKLDERADKNNYRIL